MKKKKSKITKLREEFDSASVPDYSKEDFRKIYERFTAEIHPINEAIRLRHALSRSTANTRVRV